MRISDWSSDVCSSDLREARGARGLDVEPEPRPQPLGDRLAQAGTRIGAGEDADQRDADLYRRQEAPRIGGKLPRDLGAAAPPLFGRLQPRSTRRDDRAPGQGEHTVQQKERKTPSLKS